MTELERQLTAALEKLFGQFETEQLRHFGQVEALQQRFEHQAAQNEGDLAAANRAALGATEMLGRGLQDARRDVARAVELMQQQGRQRTPERHHGPSR